MRIAVPKRSSYVYRTLRLENPAAYPLMRGRVHAYRGSAYVGTTQIAHTGPGERMEVSLGIDDDFRVERSVLHKQERKPSFFRGSRRFERHYRVRVHNRTGREGRVEVRDHFPVSKDERIEVELDREKTSRGAVIDEPRGFVRFDVAVPKHGSEAADLAYHIVLPADWDVR